jgi:hypothetical protein
MDTKHTPGPWKIVDGPQYGYNKCTRVESDHGQFGTVICERFTADTNSEVCDEYMANLRLIRALPELLDALVRLVNAPYPSSPADCLTEQGYLEDRAEYDSALTDARAAIAKATTPNT